MFKHHTNHHHRDLRNARHTREAVKRQQTFRLSVRSDQSEPAENTSSSKETKTTATTQRVVKI
jgi:hypothetical protein